MKLDNTGISKGAAKTQRVLARLRAQILEGRLEPGGRLPTFDEMTEHFGVSRAVLQSAVARLKKDGFLRSVHRQGLYVTEKPPHLHCYGVVFAVHPGQPAWSRINVALTNEIQRLERSDPSQQFKIYTGLTDEEAGHDVYKEIIDDVAKHRLAGLILLPKTYHLIDKIAEINPDFTTVTIFAPENWGFMRNVTVDQHMFYSKALSRLAEQGRQRVAIIHMSDTVTGIDHASLFAEAGLKLHEPWIQFAGRSHPENTQRLITLLMDYPPEQRPDGLVIADDNLIEHVSAGLARTGVRVDEELSVVAHTNWPWPYSSMLPMDRLGYNATDILDLAIETFHTIQDGGDVPVDQYVPAVFEWELESTPPMPASSAAPLSSRSQ